MYLKTLIYSALILGLVSGDLVFEKVKRTVDISSHVVKVLTTVTVKNVGDSVAQSLTFTTDPLLLQHLAAVTAVQKAGKKTTSLDLSSAGGDQTISLASPLAGDSVVTVEIEEVMTHVLSPFPTEIVQGEAQKVIFKGNLHLLVPYVVATSTTEFKLGSSKIESYTKVKPTSTKESVITYGPYSNVAPNTEKEVSIHYDNNSPFLTVTEMTRLVEVSHWGNIAIEEDIDMKHTGAKLRGPFSRFDYQRSNGPDASIKTFKTVLPASARDVYYRDAIGNISTSHMKDVGDAVEVEIRPRFPLFGGWKTKYTLGYNLPSYESLFVSGSDYLLTLPFLDHIYDDMVVDKMTLKVILPEGVSNIQFSCPYDVDRRPDEKHFTYLDTVGRTVVVAERSNLVDRHIQHVKISYTFSKVMLLQEPLLLISAFYLLFTLAIVYVRCDFTICPDEDSEAKSKVAYAIEKVQSAQGSRTDCYRSYDEAINKFKQSKDVSVYAGARKKVDADHKKATQEITDQIGHLKANGASGDIIEKVGELQKLDAGLKEQINLSVTYLEKLIAGRMSRGQYMDLEQANTAKKDEFFNKIELLLNLL